MLSLPATQSHLRSLFNVVDLVEMHQDKTKLSGFKQAKFSAEKLMQDDPAIRSVNSICLRANGQLWLVQFNKTGSWKKLWNFGEI